MLRPALEAAGFRIEHSEGSIYLWATRDEDCHASVESGPQGHLGRAGRLLRHRREPARTVALTATTNGLLQRLPAQRRLVRSG